MAWESSMASKHRKTYDAIYASPVRANISWNDAVTMAEALGAVVVAGRGSMFSFELSGVLTVFHRPHPGNEMPKPLVRAFRAFLEEAGVNADDL
jgi:HicA toxin of bacterial toxin-antitoxin,